MTKIYTTNPSHFNLSATSRSAEHGSSNNDTEASSIQLIYKQKLSAELSEKKRREAFTDIILNRSIGSVPKKYILHTFGYIVITIAMTLPITAIPIQDIIKNPECFYEAPLQFLHLPSILSAAFILNCSHWMNISWIKKWRHFVVISAVGLAGELICYSSGYAIWTFVLDLRYPIPFACYLYWNAIVMSQFITLYCLFPTDWRRVDAFGVRLRNMMAAIFWQVNGFTCVHAMLAALLLAFKHKYQWVIAIFLPWAREVCLWIMLKFARKASSGDLISTEITCGFTFSIWHALFHSYIVGSAATTESTMIVLVEESIIGIYVDTSKAT